MIVFTIVRVSDGVTVPLDVFAFTLVGAMGAARRDYARLCRARGDVCGKLGWIEYSEGMPGAYRGEGPGDDMTAYIVRRMRYGVLR